MGFFGKVDTVHIRLTAHIVISCSRWFLSLLINLDNWLDVDDHDQKWQKYSVPVIATNGQSGRLPKKTNRFYLFFVFHKQYFRIFLEVKTALGTLGPANCLSKIFNEHSSNFCFLLSILPFLLIRDLRSMYVTDFSCNKTRRLQAFTRATFNDIA